MITRLTIVIVLAWPVWGWAVEVPNPYIGRGIDGYTMQWCLDRGDECLDWDSVKKDYVPIKKAPTCEQRMREAMQAVNPYLVDIQHPFQLRTDWAAKEIIEHNQQAVKQWNQVMKDCVEGGK